MRERRISQSERKEKEREREREREKKYGVDENNYLMAFKSSGQNLRVGATVENKQTGTFIFGPSAERSQSGFVGDLNRTRQVYNLLQEPVEQTPLG